jgi:hypothetical protein
MGVVLAGKRRNLLDLPLSQQSRGANRADSKRLRGDDIDADCLGKSLRLLDARFSRSAQALARQFGHGDDGALAAGDVDCAVAIKYGAQDSTSVSPA